MPFLKPSQLKPSNHLGKGKKRGWLKTFYFSCNLIATYLMCTSDGEQRGEHFQGDKNGLFQGKL